MNDRDLLLWGATGFTGRLVAGHLARLAPPHLRWAIGGRNREKLEALREELGADVEVVVGDSLDRASLDPAVSGTRVVVSTAGPFAKYGTPLLEACVEHGADYCDITGETQWIRDGVDRLHDRAVVSGARVVHCCGFDSIPSDLGVWMLHDYVLRAGRGRLESVSFYLARSEGGFSGGTFASMLNLLEQAGSDPAVRKVLGHPYALNPPDRRRGPDGPDQRGARFDELAGRWTAPFLMAAINTRIVRRTNALLGDAYGEGFRYTECALARGRWQARAISLGLGALVLAGSSRPGRALIRTFAPSPGEGPSAAEREAGSFEARLIGRIAGEPEGRIEGRVRGEHDPGYGETSRMLTESALCLALDDLPARGGILTPASCMGGALLERLRAAGMTFEVREP